jgi:hypothetical protein
MKTDINICYLCGQPLSDEICKDHVPPRQFYARELRRKYGPNLFTLPVHPSCNKAYQKDEDYFVHSVGPVAMESYSGKALWGDISDRCERPQNKRIVQMVLKEFDERPSGLILPFGKVAKRFDGERVWRVVWKIVRGLFFKEIGQVLPDDLPIKYEILSPGEKPPSEYDIVHTAPPLGQYPTVFDYRYVGIPEKMYLWAMLFWDRIIMFVGFHLPGCTCRICTNNHIGDAKMITPLSVGKTRHRHEP